MGELITMSAKEIRSSSVKLGHPPPAGDPDDDTRTDEIGPSSAQAARLPDDKRRRFDILPVFTAPLDPIRQDQTIVISPEPNRCNPLAIKDPFPSAALSRM